MITSIKEIITIFMEKNKFTIEEVVEKVNQYIENYIIENKILKTDSRTTELLTVRRVRDYITKKTIPQPIKDGREAYFTQDHINALIDIRILQYNGLPQKYISNNMINSLGNLYSTSSVSQQYQDLGEKHFKVTSNDLDLNNLISSIENRKNFSNNIFGASGASSLAGHNLNNLKNLQNTFIENKKTYTEYEIEKGLIIKFDETYQNHQEVLQKIKTILNKGA